MYVRYVLSVCQLKERQMALSAAASWRDPILGDPREIDLPGGRIRVFEAGSGPTLVFVHGLLVNANLWRKPIARLRKDFRCVALDLPLGSHTLPLPPGSPNTPHTLADLIADALDALGEDRSEEHTSELQSRQYLVCR